jgi:hypothetical protein
LTVQFIYALVFGLNRTGNIDIWVGEKFHNLVGKGQVEHSHFNECRTKRFWNGRARVSESGNLGDVTGKCTHSL